MNPKMSKTIYYFLSSLLLSFAFIAIYLATKWGIGLTPDSITYIQGARGILRNIDFAGIGTHYPPFYFILLALSGLFFESIIFSARYLHIFIFVANALLFGYLLKSKTQSQWIFLLGLSIFISAAATFTTHVMAWSEPIFITFMLLNFHFISEYLCIRKNSHIILAAVFAALAVITRYIGITLIFTCLYVVLTEAQRSLKERLKNAFYFGLISGLPMFFWLLHNSLTQNQITSRSFASHIISFKQIEQGLETVGSWFFLSIDKAYLLIIVIAVLGWLYWKSYYKENPKTSGEYQLLKVSTIYMVVYIVSLLISISFFDAHTPLDQRILLPVFLCLMLIILLLFKKCLDNFKTYARTALYIGAGVFLLVQIIILEKNSAFFINNGIIYNGVGYSSRIWMTSKTIDYIRTLPTKAVIYSNGPEVINILLDRPSTMIPYLINTGDRSSNQTFSAQFDNMIGDIKSKNGYLIYFVNVNWRWYLPSLKMLVQLLPDFTIYKTEDDFIFLPSKK